MIFKVPSKSNHSMSLWKRLQITTEFGLLFLLTDWMTDWKIWLQKRQKNARFTAERLSQPCVLISSLDAIVLSGKHMSSTESPKLSIDICQHILHHSPLSYFSLSSLYLFPHFPVFLKSPQVLQRSSELPIVKTDVGTPKQYHLQSQADRLKMIENRPFLWVF